MYFAGAPARVRAWRCEGRPPLPHHFDCVRVETFTLPYAYLTFAESAQPPIHKQCLSKVLKSPYTPLRVISSEKCITLMGHKKEAVRSVLLVLRREVSRVAVGLSSCQRCCLRAQATVCYRAVGQLSGCLTARKRLAW